MSSITEITDDATFATLVSSLPSTTLLAISFHTPWAAPCAQMSLILKTLAASYPPRTPPVITFLSINAESLPDISESYDVTAVPFLVLQRAGTILESVSGSDASKVRDAVERHAGKAGNTASGGGGGGGGGKADLPPPLEATPRAETGGLDSRATTQGLGGYAPTSNDADTAAVASEPSSSEGPVEELNKRLAELVKAAPVMLFMKGTPSAPQCGFSRTLVGLLREKGVRYGFFNILADEEVRQGLKEFSSWPTFPQLYRNGELVGGLDIVKEELEGDPDFFADFAVGKGKVDDTQVQAATAEA